MVQQRYGANGFTIRDVDRVVLFMSDQDRVIVRSRKSRKGPIGIIKIAVSGRTPEGPFHSKAPDPTTVTPTIWIAKPS